MRSNPGTVGLRLRSIPRFFETCAMWRDVRRPRGDRMSPRTCWRHLLEDEATSPRCELISGEQSKCGRCAAEGHSWNCWLMDVVEAPLALQRHRRMGRQQFPKLQTGLRWPNSTSHCARKPDFLSMVCPVWSKATPGSIAPWVTIRRSI